MGDGGGMESQALIYEIRIANTCRTLAFRSGLCLYPPLEPHSRPGIGPPVAPVTEAEMRPREVQSPPCWILGVLQGPKVTWSGRRGMEGRECDINHGTPLLQGLPEGEGHGGSSVLEGCQEGEIREGFLEEVMFAPRSEGQAGIDQVQKRRAHPTHTTHLPPDGPPRHLPGWVPHQGHISS